MDVLGNPIDECGPIGEKERMLLSTVKRQLMMKTKQLLKNY